VTKYYGVICKLCETKIALGKVSLLVQGQLEFHAAPLDPIPCHACGGSYLYGSDDLVEFEAADDMPLVP
jgi:hypothetical protein